MDEVEKLVEYRTAHYAVHSEAASYFTNTPARVQFRFANPIICRLTRGTKIMRVAGGSAFDFFVGDTLYVPPGQSIDVDLQAASRDSPIECDCLEIETDLLEKTLSKINERLSGIDCRATASLDWLRYCHLTGAEANDLNLSQLMELFRGPRDVFSDLRIDANIEELLLKLVQMRSRELLMQDNPGTDNGINAVARYIRGNLGRHVPTEELAALAAMSVSSLHRHFRVMYGTTPARFANKARIAEAKHRLRQSHTPIEVLAFDLGFTDASHFSRAFRKTTGESPAVYRRRRLRLPKLAN